MDTLTQDKHQRLSRIQHLLKGKQIQEKDTISMLESVLKPGDRVCIEGNNQKQAVFLANSLSSINPKKINRLHMIQSTLSLPAHTQIFERGIANRLDFAYAGSQGTRLAQLVEQKKIQIGDIHTYLELFARYFLDLTPRVCFIVAEQADEQGNLYTGPNTEETPAIIEATAFKQGIVIVEVSDIVKQLPRVDIPGDWVDIIIKSPLAPSIKPIFTRDPAKIDEIKILMAMLVIKGIYARYQVNTLNHGIGYNTCAIELILPTYAAEMGLKGKICQHFVLNPIPTLIPAIESGFVKTLYAFGSEVGMGDYVKAHPDIFFTGRDGSLRSNRCFGQVAGLYAVDLFIGSTLQIDLEGNSSTATKDRIVGFGGAPNMGCDAAGRRHGSYAWLQAGKEASKPGQRMPRGKKLVVQLVETFQNAGVPSFVETLDAWTLQKKTGQALPPVMIYGEDVTHVVTEEGIAHLHQCHTPEMREQAIRGVAGFTPVGIGRNQDMVEHLRERKIIERPEDLGVHYRDATRELLSAKTVKEIVEWSQGLYVPPTTFRDW